MLFGRRMGVCEAVCRDECYMITAAVLPRESFLNYLFAIISIWPCAVLLNDQVYPVWGELSRSLYGGGQANDSEKERETIP